MSTSTYQRCTAPGSAECRARSIRHRRILRQCLNCAQVFHASGTEQHTNVCPACTACARRAATSTRAGEPAAPGTASAYRAFADYIGDRRQRGIPTEGSSTVAQHKPSARGSYRGPANKRQAFEEDLQFLLNSGTPFSDIMTRLNIEQFRKLERRLERAGRGDLLSRLKETPPASRQMPPEGSPDARSRAANDRLARHLMVKARFEADRARRGIPTTGERRIHIVLTDRFIPVFEEVA